MTKNNKGRQPLITDKLCNEICDYIRAGLPPVIAANKAGISTRSHHRWIQKGKEAKTETKYKRYWHMIEGARAVAADEYIKKIEQSGDWKAFKWLLERMAPDIFTEDKKPLKLEGDIKHEHSIKHNEQLLKDPIYIENKAKAMDNYYKQNKNKKKEAPDQ